MKIINIIVTAIFVSIICLTSNSYAFFMILNNGHWLERMIEDPMTDEIIYESRVNSVDIQEGKDNTGSEAVLFCIYNKTKKTLNIKIDPVDMTCDINNIYEARYRFDKEQPKKCKVVLKRDTNRWNRLYIIGVDTINDIQNGLVRSNKFTFCLSFVDKYTGDYKYQYTFDVSGYKELAPVTSKQRIGY